MPAENAGKTQDTVVACWQKQVLQSPSHLEAVAIPGEAETSAMCVGGSFLGIKMDVLDPPLWSLDFAIGFFCMDQ